VRVDADTQADLDAEVASSSFGDRLEVNAWYDGELVAEHLDVLDWSIGWDATRQVQGQSSWTFADPEGTLAPWALDDALAPGGAQLQVTWVLAVRVLRFRLVGIGFVRLIRVRRGGWCPMRRSPKTLPFMVRALTARALTVWCRRRSRL